MTPPPVASPHTTRLVALPSPVFTSLVATVLSACVAANDRLPSKGPITRFHAKEKPALEIGAYLSRLTVYTPFQRDAVLLSLVYLDRISRLPLPASFPSASATPLFPTLPSSMHQIPTSLPSRSPSPIPLLNSFCLHRLLMATLLVSSKFTSDGFIPQSRAAKVGGTPTRELVRLEVEVLKALEWSLYFSMEEVEAVSRTLLEIGEATGQVARVAPSPSGTADITSDAVMASPSESPCSSSRPELLVHASGIPRLTSPESSASNSSLGSPPLFSPPRNAQSPTPPSSPPSPRRLSWSSDAADGTEEEGNELAERKSSETVRRVGALSLESERDPVEGVASTS